jgi:CheY-like chemotaxis protein
VDDWEPPSNATRIGAIRLKHMLVERPKEALPEIVEKPLVIRDEGAADLAELDAVDLEEVGEGQPVALVVDDDDAIRKMLVVALQHDGLTVLEAKTGEEAVTMLRLARPDVVLLDVQLPVISGLEICSSLKKSQHKDVPVIMVSGVHKGLEQAREIVEVYGADHFVEKPFEVTFVRRLVGDLLKRPHAPHPAVDSGLVDDVRRRYDEHAAAGLWFAAAADVEQWIALDRFDGRAWLERGNLAAHGGDLVGAMMAFEAAVVYAPGLVTAQLGLAMVYEQLGFRRRARAVWLRARDLTPDDAVKAQIDAHLR